MRTSVHAEEEIREVFDEIAKICVGRWSHIFQDFERNEEGEWIAKYKKV